MSVQFQGKGTQAVLRDGGVSASLRGEWGVGCVLVWPSLENTVCPKPLSAGFMLTLPPWRPRQEPGDSHCCSPGFPS